MTCIDKIIRKGVWTEIPPYQLKNYIGQEFWLIDADYSSINIENKNMMIEITSYFIVGDCGDDTHIYQADGDPFLKVKIINGDKTYELKGNEITKLLEIFKNKTLKIEDADDELVILKSEGGSKILIYPEFKPNGCYDENGKFHEIEKIDGIPIIKSWKKDYISIQDVEPDDIFT